MRQILPIALLALLAGCVTAPAGTQLDDTEMRTLVRNVAAELDQFSYLFGVDGEPDFTTVQADLANVRVQLAGRTTFGLDAAGLRQLAAAGALGVTISVCEDSLSRLRLLYDQDRASAMEQVRGRFRLSCVVPLGLQAAA